MIEPSHRVLVVDDEPFNVEYLDQELTDRGYGVDSAVDGPSALEAVHTSPPDLVLLDVLMPGIDGIEVCRRLKSDPETRLIPVIIMTALSEREDRIRGIEAGADDFLTKPVDLRELFARIRTALRTKELVDETVDELRSVAQRVTELGKHDEELAVVVALPGPTGIANIESIAEAEGGLVAFTPDGSCAAAFRGSDPARTSRAAVEAAMAAATSGSRLGVALGSALIGVDQGESEEKRDWSMSIEGPTTAAARAAAESAESGQVLITASVLGQLPAGYEASVGTGAADQALFEVTRGEPVTDQAGLGVGFPPEFSHLVPMLESEWGIADLYLVKTLSGKSGARVIVVDISCEGYSGLAILKLEIPDDDPSDWELEAARHERAIDHNEGYAVAHLPRLLKFIGHEGHTATLSTIAAGGLEYCLAWFRSSYESQLISAERISNDVLESWNSGYELAPGLELPSSMLQSWMSHRLELGVSRLDALATDTLGIDPAEPSFIIDGAWCPNPIAFARSAGDFCTEPMLRGVVGQQHGDLHGYNVLTSQRRTDVSDYFLIDLAYYQERSYLFFDHGYFELSYLLRTREDAGYLRWIEVLRSVFGEGVNNGDDIGIVRIVDAIRAGQHRWIRDHEANRTGYMESQMLLGQVAAGLNYANKRMELDRKVKSFLYAAFALKEFIDLQRLKWPRDGSVAVID